MNIPIYKNKNIIISWAITLILFILFIFIGYKTVPSDTSNIDSNIINYKISEIFLNNSKITLYNYIGILSLGSFNLFNLINNGLIIGHVLKFGIGEFGLLTSILKLLPHAIFEIPAIIISISVGFLPIIVLISKSKKHHDTTNFKYYCKYIFYSFLFVTFLNFIAAIVESTISMKF